MPLPQSVKYIETKTLSIREAARLFSGRGRDWDVVPITVRVEGITTYQDAQPRATRVVVVKTNRIIMMCLNQLLKFWEDVRGQKTLSSSTTTISMRISFFLYV